MKKFALLNLGIALSILVAASPASRAEDTPKPDKAMPAIKYDPSPLPPNTPSYAPIVEKVAPCVVTISTLKMVHGNAAVSPYGNNPLFNDPNFRRFFGIPDQDGNDDQVPARHPDASGSRIKATRGRIPRTTKVTSRRSVSAPA